MPSPFRSRARSILLCSSILALILAIPAPGRDARRERDTVQPRRNAASWLPGTLIVKLKESAPNRRNMVRFGIPAIDAVLDRIGMDARRSLFPLAPYPEGNMLEWKGEETYRGFDRVYVITYTLPYDPRQVATEITRTGLVEFAEPYYTFPISYTPNDSRLSDQSWLMSVEARQAWDITKGDSAIAIGIVDTGIDWEHDDLRANIRVNPGESGKDTEGRDRGTNGVDDDGNGLIDDVHGWDFVGRPTMEQLQAKEFLPDNDPRPRANSEASYRGYHGTLVAGCAGATPDNERGIAGTGFNTKIIPIKCAGDSLGSGTVTAGYDGIRYAADMGARVINCSWGGSLPEGETMALQTVVNYAYTRGSLVVAAAGNLGTNNDLAPSYPANLKHVLTAGASTPGDSSASFSQYGVTVDVWAPGVDILTTVPGNGYATTINSEPISGTSYSAPIVSGIAALVFALHPDWTPDQVAMQLRVTGDRLRPPAPQLAPYFFRKANAHRATALNKTLAEGDPTGIPGVGIESYLINGRATDTLRNPAQGIAVQLTLKNYLSPVHDLKVEAIPDQMLALAEPITIASLGTMESATRDIAVTVASDDALIYSEGTLQLVLKLTSGIYEDYVAIQVPVKLPGWHQQLDPIRDDPFASHSGEGIIAVTPDLAWALSLGISQGRGTSFFARTTDGMSWSPFTVIPTDNDPLYCLTARDAERAWAGSGPQSTQAAIFRTLDGGENWEKKDVRTITGFVDAIHFFDDRNGIFIGDPLNGKWGIGVTSDGGESWSGIETPPVPGHSSEAAWTNALAAYGDNIWFGTNNNRIYYSTDRGRTWKFSLTQSPNAFSVAFATANDGLSVFGKRAGGVGTDAVMASRDGGRSWTATPLPFPDARPQWVTFVPGTTRAFVATQNGVFETSDFGANWKRMAMPPIFQQGVILTAQSDGNGNVGAYGTNTFSQLMNYADSGAILSTPLAPDRRMAVSNETATLFQNRPNPFASHSTISFSLRVPADVQLLLYDALGLEIATIVNERLEPGTHTVEIDAAHLPPGTYYYRLIANGERLTRKMVIVR